MTSSDLQRGWRAVAGSSLLVVVMLGRSSEGACGPNQFALSDSVCCDECPKGWYVTANCSQSGHHAVGISCTPCSTCVTPSPTPAATTPDETSTLSVLPKLPVDSSAYISLYVMSSVVVVLLILTTIWKWCSTRKSPEDSKTAQEPCKAQLLHV
ncbi:hypothetical protein NFI96_017424 [Prochilodus magdalenae]|nr:hypothetical protein NFI96_017424 [Prochilodus magdalenae]